MSWDFARESAWQFALTLWHVLPWLAGMGVVFTDLSTYSKGLIDKLLTSQIERR